MGDRRALAVAWGGGGSCERPHEAPLCHGAVPCLGGVYKNLHMGQNCIGLNTQVSAGKMGEI